MKMFYDPYLMEKIVDTKASIAKTAFHFFSGTFSSRIFGMIREITTAFVFGTNPAIAAFFVAFRFANLFRRLFGESALLAGFIPHFESIRAEDPKKSALFFLDSIYSMIVFLLPLLIAVEMVLYWFYKAASDYQQIFFLTMILLPGVLFICLYGLFSALLQCEKKYFLPAFSPVLFNVVWIVSVILFSQSTQSIAIIGLAISVGIGFFVQWIVLLKGVIAYLKPHFHLRDWLKKAKLFSKEIRYAAKSVLYGIIGVGAVQINSVLDSIFARFASNEGPAYLYYAIRLEQLPLALFGVAFSSALLPPLTRALKSNNMEQFIKLLTFSLTKTLALLLPCSFAIFTLGLSGVNLLFGRGAFDLLSTMYTTHALWGYGIGLLPAAIAIILTPAFYAQKDYKTPMRASIYSVLLNIILNFIMVVIFNKGATSVAITTSICAFFNAAYLFSKLSKKMNFSPQSLFPSLNKLLLINMLCLFLSLFVAQFILKEPLLEILFHQARLINLTRDFPLQLLHFLTLFSSFSISYFFLGWFFKEIEITNLLSFFKQRPSSENNLE